MVELGTGRLAVDAGPAPLGPRQRRAEQLLGLAPQVVVGVFAHVERERLVVGVGVADGQAAVQPLYQQQLGPRRGGGRGLRREPVAAGQVEGRVVAQRVTVGHRGGEPAREGLRLHHLQPDPAHRRPLVAGQVRAGHAGMRRAGAQHDQVAPVPLAGVVAHRVRGDLGRLAARPPAVAGGPARPGQQVLADGGQGEARLDHGVPAAAQPPGELAAQRRVDLAGRGCVEELVTADRGVGPCRRLLQQLQLGLAGRQRQRPVRPEADARHLRGQLLPARPGPQGQAQLGPAVAAADPDQPEVADAGTARLGLALEVQDVKPAPPGRHRVHRAEHPAAHHHHAFHARCPPALWPVRPSPSCRGDRTVNTARQNRAPPPHRGRRGAVRGSRGAPRAGPPTLSSSDGPGRQRRGRGARTGH